MASGQLTRALADDVELVARLALGKDGLPRLELNHLQSLRHHRLVLLQF